jgi:hypothetical protein
MIIICITIFRFNAFYEILFQTKNVKKSRNVIFLHGNIKATFITPNRLQGFLSRVQILTIRDNPREF